MARKGAAAAAWRVVAAAAMMAAMAAEASGVTSAWQRGNDEMMIYHESVSKILISNEQ